MPRIVERPIARQELTAIATRIGQDRPATAQRFLAAARNAYELLATMPEVGTNWETVNPNYQGVRYFPIRRFRNFVIFYRPLSDGVEVLHILHGARDLQGFFAANEE